MQAQPLPRALLNGSGVEYLHFGYGTLVGMDEDVVRVRFSSGEKTFKRDIFIKHYKPVAKDDQSELQIRMAIERNIIVPQEMVPFLPTILDLFDVEGDQNAAFKDGALSLCLPALNQRHGKTPAVNRGKLFAAQDALQFEYAVFFRMDENALEEDDAYDVLAQEEHLGLLHGLLKVAALYDPDIKLYGCAMEPFRCPFLEEDTLKDGLYVGLCVQKRVHSAFELTTVARLIELFMKQCDFWIASASYEEEAADSPEDAPSENEIALSFRDFVVISSRQACIFKNHDMEKVRAVLCFVYENGETKEYCLPAFYCKDCQEYYVHAYDYEKAKGFSGRPLCRVVYEQQYRPRVQPLHNGFSELAEQSDLRLYGYNVNKNEGLTKEQRRRILDGIIADRVLNLLKVKSHIAWLIRRNKDNIKLEDAVQKWQSDLDYLNDRYMRDGKKIRVSALYTKRPYPQIDQTTD